VRLREHRRNLKEGLLEKSKLAQHAYEDHKVGWSEAGILEIEINNSIADPTFDYCLSQGFVGYWLVSSVRQAIDSYLGGPLNGETLPQTTGGTQPLC
jgi:hypothetical protein